MTSDVVILGGTAPAALAALELAKVGLRVRLVCDEIVLPDHPVTDASGEWAAFFEQLEVPATVTPAEPRAVRAVKGGIVPVAAGSIMGIPSSPLSSDVSAAIGGAASFRAYLDRMKPLLTIGKAHRLNDLVVNRMGQAVLTTLVEPLVRDRFGAPAAEVDVALAVPGLNEAITRTGSLSTAVLSLLDADAKRTTRIAPEDGWPALRERIDQQLEHWSVEAVRANPAEVDLDDDAFSRRALVCAGDADLALQCGAVDADAIAQVAYRSVSEWRIAIGDGEQLLGLTCAVGAWSLHVTAGDGTEVLVELRSDRTLGEAAVEPTVEDVRTLLELAEIEPVGDVELLQSGTEVAPFTTLEEEHVFSGMQTVANESPNLRVFGDWMFGGDTSATLGFAREVSQGLRRELLGLI